MHYFLRVGHKMSLQIGRDAGIVQKRQSVATDRCNHTPLLLKRYIPIWGDNLISFLRPSAVAL